MLSPHDYLPICAVAPEQPGSAFVADRAGAWREILCIQDERRVGNDNTVKWHGLHLQLPPSPLRPHFVKARVRVHEYPDGTLAVRSEEHTSELQSLMRISYAVFCLKKKTTKTTSQIDPWSQQK